MPTKIIPGFVKDLTNNRFASADGDIKGEDTLNVNANTLGRQLVDEERNNPNPDNALVFSNLVSGQSFTYDAFRYPTLIQLGGTQGGNITLTGMSRSIGDDGSGETLYYAGTPQQVAVPNDELAGHIWFIEPAAGVTVNTKFVNDLEGGGIHYVIDNGTQQAAVHNHEGGNAKEVLNFRANAVNASLINGGYKAIDFTGQTQNANANYVGKDITDIINITASNVTQNLSLNVTGNGSAFITTGNAKDVIDLSGFIGDGNSATADTVFSASLGGDIVKGANDTFEFLDFRNGLPSSVANIRVTAVNPEAFSNNNLRPDSDLKVEYLAANGSVIQGQGFTAEKFNGILYGNQNLSVADLVRDNGGTITFANPGQNSATNLMSPSDQAEFEQISRSLKNSNIEAKDKVDNGYTEAIFVPRTGPLPEKVVGKE